MNIHLTKTYNGDILNENESHLRLKTFFERKRKMKKMLIILAGILMLCSCMPEENDDSGKMTVYTSFYGMYDFAKTIAGDCAEVDVLMPSGVEVHDWEPSASDMIALGEADVFVYSSAEMEAWAEEVCRNAENENMSIVVASEGVTELSEDSGHTDPHVWLNPKNAIIQLGNITDAFCEKDPENEEYYRANFENARTRLTELDNEYAEAVAEFSDSEIIITHGAFAYLCDAYGLSQRMLEGLNGESDPSAASMRELIDYMRENDKKTIFYISAEGEGAAASVAAETGAELYPLDPFENGTGKSYCEVMKENLEILKKALGNNEQ